MMEYLSNLSVALTIAHSVVLHVFEEREYRGRLPASLLFTRDGLRLTYLDLTKLGAHFFLFSFLRRLTRSGDIPRAGVNLG